MRTAVTRSGVVAVLRALLPLVLSVGLLVAGLVVAPGSATPATPADAPADSPEATSETANVTLYDAEDRSFADASELEAAIEDERVTDAGEMTVNETLVVVIKSKRLASEMDERNGSTTERFAAALDGPADLYLVQTNPGTMVTRTFALVGAENLTAYRNGSTVYALVDTGEVVFRKERTNGTHPVDSTYEDRFAVDFGFDLYEPPWEPPGEPPWGPTFTLTDERFVTPEPTPTRTPTDSPTQPTTGRETSIPANGTRIETTSTATQSETSSRSSANESGPGSGTATTVHEDGAGFTAGGALAALLSVVLFRRHRQ